MLFNSEIIEFEKLLWLRNCTQPTASSNLAVLGIFLIQLFPHCTACSPITYTNYLSRQSGCRFSDPTIRVFGYSRFSTSNQNSINKETTSYDLHSCPPSMRTANLSFMAYGTRNFQHSIRTTSTKRRQLTTRQSPLVSAVRANCLWTANLLFVEVTHLGHQNQKKLMQ